MPSIKNGKFLKQITRYLSSRQSVSQLLIVGVLFFAYVGVFWLLIEQLGAIVSVFLSVPVIAASLFFGQSMGLLTSLTGFALNIFLLLTLGGYDSTQLTSGWPGYLAILVISFIAGYIHDENIARKRFKNEMYSRERFITLISIATNSIINSQGQEDTYYRLISHIANLFIADYAYLIRWEKTKEQATLISTTRTLQKTFSPIILQPDETKVIQEVLQSGHAMFIEDVENSTYTVIPSPYRDLSSQTKSALIIPFAIKDFQFGAIILAFEAPRSFTQEELSYVELVGNQITLAFRTVQQQREIEAQLREAKALANIERALSESERVGVDKVLQLIVDSAIELIPKAKNAILHLIDDEKQFLVPRAVAGYQGKDKRKLNMRLGEGVAGQVITTGKVITLEDVNLDNRFLKRSTSVRFRSLVVAPIRSRDESIGTISIHSDVENAFSLEEVTLLETLGTQVAIGIDNANLLETTQQNLKEINALYRISQVLVAPLTEEQVMKNVAELLQENFRYQHVIIFTMDFKSRELVARHGSGKAASQLVEQGFRLSDGEGIVGHVANTGEPFVTNDVKNVVFYKPHPLLPDAKSALAIPIKIQNQVIGVLNIEQNSSHLLTERQMNLLIAVADQLAIALNRIDLLDSLEQRVQQRTHDLVVLYNLITIISENWRLQDLLELSLVLTLETVKADRGIIYLIDGKDDPGLKAVIQRGFGESFQVEMDRLPDEKLVQEVLRQQRSLLLEDLKNGFGDMEPTSFAGIPILARGNVRGVFGLFADKKDVFTPEKMALLASIADHLGIGIENSILWEQSRENAAIEERNRLARNLHDSVSQLLYSLTLMAGTTRKMLEREPDVETVKRSVERFEDTAHQALKEMRLLLYELRPAVLESEGMVSALKHRIGTVEERLGVKVDIQAKGLPDLPSDMEDALYHIALEALNNVVKHAESKTASIKIATQKDNIVLEISDEGRGFDSNQPWKGQGLRNMHERGQMLGGEVTIESKPGQGTRVTVKVKIPSESLVSS